MTTKHHLRDLLRGALDEGPRDLKPHPPKELLLDLVRGQVVAENAEDLREHLASCRRCQAILRVEHFAGQATEEVSIQSEQEAVFEAVVSRLETRPDAPPDASVPVPAPERWAAARPRLGSWFALAAAFALAVLGFLWMGQLRKAEQLEMLLDSLKKPTLVEVYSLLPRNFKVREGQESSHPLNSIRCLEGGNEAVWIIPTGQMIREGQKEVEISILREGLELWKGNLTASRQGTVDLRLPATFLVPGKLEVRLKPEAGSEALVFDVQYDCPGS